MPLLWVGDRKANVNVAGVVEKLNLPGAYITSHNVMARCPNPSHDDGSPSFGVDLRTGVFHCYGCGYKGTLLKLVMDTQKVDQDRAKNMMLNAFPREWANLGVGVEDKREFKIWPEYTLDSLSPKYDYLEERGISRETQDEWEIKYNPDEDRHVVPVRHTDQKIIGFIGLASKELRKDPEVKKVLYSPKLYISKTMLGIHKFRGKTCVLVEGAIDALKVYEALQRPSVCAILHSHLTDGQASLLDQFGLKRVLCMYDNDEAGQKAFRITQEKLGRKMLVQRVPYEADDPGDMNITQIREILLGKPSAG